MRHRPSARVAPAILVSAWLVACLAAPARASVLGEAIGAQTDIDEYRHVLEDLLYRHLGDNCGFGPEHDLSRDNIVAYLEATGLTVTLEPFLHSGQTYHNIVAEQTGADDPSRIVVVGAHFDTVNNPGADDNGTGTALVMEMARVLSPHRPRRTIRYVLFDREEQGLVGSGAYVDAHADETIMFALTADMVGHDSGAYGMDIYGTPSSSAIVNGVAAAMGTYGDGLNPFVNIGTFSFSDHWSFESAGIPACVIIERCFSCNANYHTPNDAVDVAPDYITYPMVADLLRTTAGYLVDAVGITVFGDASMDGAVDVADIVAVILAWGPCPAPPAACPADLDRDGDVDVQDLVEVILHWGA